MLDIEFTNLCRYVEYEFIPAGQNVFNYGEIGDKFYMLLKGRVGIIVPLKSQVLDLPISWLEVKDLKEGSFGELAL